MVLCNVVRKVKRQTSAYSRLKGCSSEQTSPTYICPRWNSFVWLSLAVLTWWVIRRHAATSRSTFFCRRTSATCGECIRRHQDSTKLVKSRSKITSLRQCVRAYVHVFTEYTSTVELFSLGVYVINCVCQEFDGPPDHKTIKTTILNPTVSAKFVRVVPRRYYVRICLRLELYGQEVDAEGSGKKCLSIASTQSLFQCEW